jgi:DNA topoisomerase-1
LLIVESPAKAKTIQKYLGADYGVTASIGHLFDLPRSRLAIDVEKNFKPEYITIRGKAKILKEILKEAKKAERILLASDNDREGEAIAFHLRNAILKKFPDMEIKRIVFNEITPVAIQKAVESPMVIDINKVNAQKARRILDRLVGYKLSPILWKKVKNGLSAGRVQSVALRLICERDREVEAFIPREYWTIDATLKKGKKTFTAQLVQYQGKKPEITSKEGVHKLIELFKDNPFRVKTVKQKDKQTKPLAPFTTSKLQQTAATRLGYTSRKSMRIAQILYEGINIGSDRVGLITYMRTDSTRIADSALEALRHYIGKEYPDELPEKPNAYAVGKKAQDAHEAIRPTAVERTPDSIKGDLTPEQFKLYSLIWERFVSSQMKPHKSRIISVEFECKEGLFRASATKVLEKGFYKALKLLAPKEKKQTLPAFS